MTKSSPKQRLSKALKVGLQSKGFTLVKAAKTLGIKPDTLRGWISRNRFPQEELLRLAQLAGLPTDLIQLRGRYIVNLQTQPELLSSGGVLRTLDEALSFLDTRIDDQLRLYRDFGHDVRLLFGALAEGDIFVYCALDELPYELDSLGWTVAGELVAQAIERKAHLIYFHPSQQIVDAMRSLRLRKVPNPSEFADALSQFKLRIMKMKPNLDVDYISEHVIAVECDVCPFMVPGHKYVLFFHSKSPSTARSLARFPIGSSEKEMSLHLPLSQSVTSQFLNFVLASLQRRGYEHLMDLFRIG
jgi:hypothetical protein